MDSYSIKLTLERLGVKEKKKKTKIKQCLNQLTYRGDEHRHKIDMKKPLLTSSHQLAVVV